MASPTAPVRRVLVAEDEPAARRHLARSISRHAGFHVVAEASSGTEAIALARAEKPDVVFLDIQMPGADGFDVVRELTGPAMPLIVFVTAHDDYAIQAFDVRALDYLLKPFDDRRLERAIATVVDHLEGRALAELRGHLTELVAARKPLRRPAAAAARLTIRTSTGILFVPLATISHVTADGYCAMIHTPRKVHHIRESLLSLAARLPPAFVRVHRSAIVNVNAVESVEPLTHGEARLQLVGGAAVKASRSFRRAIEDLVGY